MALEGAAVAASATFGCGALGVAVYSNVTSFLKAEREKNEEAPDCAARIIEGLAKAGRQVCETPELVRAAFTDPLEELRKAGQEPHCQLASPAEFSVGGEALKSGYATFNGEVLKAGRAVSSVVPLLALAGAQVQRDGKTLTVIPKQAPVLLLQLEDVEQAAHWEIQLGTASNKHADPVDHLDRVVGQAHELMKHLFDVRAQIKRPPAHHKKPEDHGHGHHGGGHGSPPAHGPVSNEMPGSAPPPGAPEPQGENHAEKIEEMKHSMMLAECKERALQQQVDSLSAQLAASDKARIMLKAELDLAKHQLDAQPPQELAPTSPSAAAQQDPEMVKLKMKMHTAQEATRLGELQKELQAVREELQKERAEAAKQASFISDLERRLKKSEEELGVSKKQEAEQRQRERKLSSQEVQAMRAHLQSMQRRNQSEGSSGEGLERQLKEMAHKIKDGSPSRSPARSQRQILEHVEQAQAAEESRTEMSPKSPSRSPVPSTRSAVLQHSPLRRPSPAVVGRDLHSTESAQTLTFDDWRSGSVQVLGPPQPLQPAAPEAFPPNMFLQPQPGRTLDSAFGGPWLPWVAADRSTGPAFSPVLATPPHPASFTLPIGNTLAPPSNGSLLGSWRPSSNTQAGVTPERPASMRLPARTSPTARAAATQPATLPPATQPSTSPSAAPVGRGGIPIEPIVPI